MVETLRGNAWNGSERRKTKRLLYLDDEPDELVIFRINAEAMGFDVTTVKYPSDFIKEFEGGRYDVAITDYILSSVDGINLMRLLHREKSPDTKLYIFTAYDKNLVIEKVNGDKINGVLAKSDGIQKALAEVVNG